MIFDWSVFVINGFVATGILIIPIVISVIQFVKTREKTQLYLSLLWIFYTIWIFFQALFTLLLEQALFVYIGTYSMIGVLIFAIVSGENIVRGKQNWPIMIVLVVGICLFVIATYDISNLFQWPFFPLIPPEGTVFLIVKNSSYDIGYNIMFMTFSFALFYYMALLKINLSSENKRISNFIIIGGIFLGLLPHLSSIILSGYPPSFLNILPTGSVERLFYFPGFEFLLIAIGALMISYTFKKEPKLNRAYQFIIKKE